MNLTTKVYMGVRTIGNSDDPGQIWEGPMTELIKKLIPYLSKATLKKRIDITIGYEEIHVVNHIMGTRANKKIQNEEILDAAEEMMARINSGESLATDDPEDTYQD